MRKSVVILQSSYIPWRGYFDLIQEADEFIFLDDVQFTKQDWRTRNSIKTMQGARWLSIPAGNDINRRICDVAIKDHNWQAKHFKTISQNYVGCQHFSHYEHFLKSTYLDRRWDSLSELNQYVTTEIATRFLGLATTFRDSREFGEMGRNQERLINILHRTGGTRYISGPSAKSYISEPLFQEAGIELVWKDYSGYPDYPQKFPPFVPNVSILDLLFNVGPDAPWYIWGWRSGPLAR